MTNHTQQAAAPRPTLYEQALVLQDQLVSRGVLIGRTHEVLVDDSYDTVRNTTVIHCTCGEWMVEYADRAQRAYADHIVAAIRVRLGLAA